MNYKLAKRRLETFEDQLMSINGVTGVGLTEIDGIYKIKVYGTKKRITVDIPDIDVIYEPMEQPNAFEES